MVGKGADETLGALSARRRAHRLRPGGGGASANTAAICWRLSPDGQYLPHRRNARCLLPVCPRRSSDCGITSTHWLPRSARLSRGIRCTSSRPRLRLPVPAIPSVGVRNYAGKIVYEGELGIVIGRLCKEVTDEQAPSHIFGYTCVNDVTAIDLHQRHTGLRTVDTRQELRHLRRAGAGDRGRHGCFRAQCDHPGSMGIERQHYPIADMIFSPPQIVCPHFAGYVAARG